MRSGKQEPWPGGINLPFLGEAWGQPLTRVKCRGGHKGQARRTGRKYCTKVGRRWTSSPAGPQPLHNGSIARRRGWEAIKGPAAARYVGNLGP